MTVRRFSTWMAAAVVSVALLSWSASVLDAAEAAKPSDWKFNATIIEACSCPMFCQCYFNSEPAAHGAHAGHGEGGEHAGHGGGEHFCRFNNAFRVNRGAFGKTKLDGAKFWVAGDLGSEFQDGKMDWAVLTFDPAVTPEQREGIKTILGHVYPVQWDSFTVHDDAAMEWKADKDKAEARLGGGQIAEVVLKRHPGMTSEPVVIDNLVYWGVPRNDGFVLMPNEVEAWRAGDNAFEFKGTNGFMITLDMTSKDVTAPKK